MNKLEWNGIRIKCPHCGSLRAELSIDKKTEYHCKRCEKDFGTHFDTENIKEIFFVSGGYLSQERKTRFYLKNNGCIMEDGLFFNRADNKHKLSMQDWENIKATLFELFFVNDWEESYDNCCVMDGFYWKLKVITKNGKPFETGGSNAYPKLYKELEKFIRTYTMRFR